MRKILLLSFAMLIIAANLSAMRMLSDEDFKKAGLSDAEITKVKDIYAKYDKERRVAAAELNIYRAKIERELLADNVNINEVEKMLKESYEWKIKMDMAQIRMRVEVKKAVGDEKWQRLTGYFMRMRHDDDRDMPTDKNRKDNMNR